MPDNQCLPIQLNEVVAFEQVDQLWQYMKQQISQILVADVACADNQEPGGSAAQEMTANKISILAEDNTMITIRDGGNYLIGAAIACR